MSILESFFPELFSFNNSKYLPFNIVKKSDTEMVLEMELVGVTQDNLEVEVENNVLTVSNKKSNDTKNYLYKGIPGKTLNQKFRLRDDILVKNGTIKDGMLCIDLEIKKPEGKKPRKVTIKH